jgi:arylsulfatase
MAVRYGPWKITFKTIEGNLFTGHEASTNVPIMTNLRQDPWERYQDQSMMYGKWWAEKLWTVVPAGLITAKYLQTFKEFPPSQVGGSFGVERMLQKVKASFAAARK